jgi:hypothetical protein
VLRIPKLVRVDIASREGAHISVLCTLNKLPENDYNVYMYMF